MGVEIDHKNITFDHSAVANKKETKLVKDKEEEKVEFQDVDAVKYSSHSSFMSIQNGNDFS